MQQDRQRQAETAPRSAASGRGPHIFHLPSLNTHVRVWSPHSQALQQEAPQRPSNCTAPGMLSGFWGLPPSRLQCLKKHLPCPEWTLPTVANLTADCTPRP